MNLSNIVIILCRPSEPGNTGAVCRAMKNSGLEQLRLVLPETMNEAALLARTVHAQDIWENARRYENLAEAVKDCSLVIGTTRRRGKRRKIITMTARETALFLKDYPAESESKAALVFGNERTGLENDELTLCNFSSHIDANEEFASLNLSHCVQIYGYELYNTLSAQSHTRTAQGEWFPVSRAELDALVAKIGDSLASLGFYAHTGREQQAEFFRDVFSRAGLTAFEARYMQNIFAKAARLAAK